MAPGDIAPPSSGSSPSHPPPSSGKLPDQVQTGMSQPYNVKGQTAIKAWAKRSFPGMSDAQLDKFAQQFLMSICKSVSQQIAKELARARKLAKELQKAETGDDDE